MAARQQTNGGAKEAHAGAAIREECAFVGEVVPRGGACVRLQRNYSGAIAKHASRCNRSLWRAPWTGQSN